MYFFAKYKNNLPIVISTTLYLYFAYFVQRTDFTFLLFLWLFLFGCFFWLLKDNSLNSKNLIGAAVFFRVLFLFAAPNLSQDFYRFIWDGRMLLEGFNPYLYLPESFIHNGIEPINQATLLYQGMGQLNGSHYTNYPPVNQLCFFLAALIANKSILASTIALRCIIILADIGIIYTGKKLLERLNLPVKNIYFYALNPFIIIELTGNLHFEPVMLFFLILSLYKLHKHKWVLAAVFLACSISVKLIPLLFVPIFFQWFTQPHKNKNNLKKNLFKENFTIKNLSRLFGFYSIIFFTVLLFFLPFYNSNLITNYSNSLGLWFGNFEFNASFYYIFRQIGYLFRGYNEIAVIGKITPILTIVFLLFLTFFKENKSLEKVFTAMLFAICFYYFTATTVHPWYLATPVVLSVFTSYRFPVIWTFTVVLSYQAYSNIPRKENLWLVGIEYALLFGFMFFERYQKKYHIKLN